MFKAEEKEFVGTKFLKMFKFLLLLSFSYLLRHHLLVFPGYFVRISFLQMIFLDLHGTR